MQTTSNDPRAARSGDTAMAILQRIHENMRLAAQETELLSRKLAAARMHLLGGDDLDENLPSYAGPTKPEEPQTWSGAYTPPRQPESRQSAAQGQQRPTTNRLTYRGRAQVAFLHQTMARLDAGRRLYRLENVTFTDGKGLGGALAVLEHNESWLRVREEWDPSEEGFWLNLDGVESCVLVVA